MYRCHPTWYPLYLVPTYLVPPTRPYLPGTPDCPRLVSVLHAGSASGLLDERHQAQFVKMEILTGRPKLTQCHTDSNGRPPMSQLLSRNQNPYGL